MAIKRHNLAKALSILLLHLAPAAQAFENKIDVTAGYFSLSGKNSSTGATASVSGLAAYRLGYRRAMSSHFDIGVGYSLAFSKVIGGDSVFGLDVQARYYPITASGSVKSENDDITLVVSESLRPYLGLGFLQRNFQGIQTTYVGFGGLVGCEVASTPTMSYLGEIRFASLNASSTNTATELVLSLGVSFGF
ncbi:MAG: hypothetical protein JST80_01420 [Bdellovibrionales bacterium]|nr:hypothetical protein [Bdellovibrionales bacterium]